MGQSGLLLLLILFMGGMLFVSSRQRKKQQQQQDDLQKSITEGDVVRMTCGISGTVVDNSDELTIDIEIAPDMITTWLRAAVREKLTAEGGHEEIEGADDTVEGVSGGSAHPSPADTVDSSPSDAVGSPTEAGRNGSEPSGEVSSPRTS